jgi:hypothetical protein
MDKFSIGWEMQFGGSWATSGRQGQWLLRHDNAPSHTSLVVQQFLAEKSNPVITQPPHSPGLVLSAFWLFPTVKIVLNGTCFPTMEGIKLNATVAVRKIPKEAFRRCRIDGVNVFAPKCPTLKMIV